MSPPPLPHAPARRLRAKPVRTASGIAVVAVMSKPHRCPHIATTGNICVYCPGGPDSDFEYSTQSYTGGWHGGCSRAGHVHAAGGRGGAEMRGAALSQQGGGLCCHSRVVLFSRNQGKATGGAEWVYLYVHV